jgi:Zn-dependent protease
MLAELFTNPFGFLIWIIALLVAITVHECAHAWTAERLGDPTAKLMGRVTLNPFAHLDLVGTLMLLIARIGWGKPVPVDPFNFRNPRRDMAITSFAGPAADLILAAALSIILRITFLFLGPTAVLIEVFFQPIIILCVTLAIFNLLPIHPLDGGSVLAGLLPSKTADEFEAFSHQYGVLILILLIFPFFGQPLISRIIFPIVNFILSLLLPGSMLV